MEITSPNNPQIKHVKQLQQKKYREISQSFIVEGEHLVLDAIELKKTIKVYVLVGTDVSKLSCQFIWVTHDVMKKMTELKSVPTMLAICKFLTKTPSSVHKALILESVQDPSNVGALIRSAVAFGFDVVYLDENCADLYNSKTIRATQGGLFMIPITRVSLVELILQLKQQHFTIYSTSLKGQKLHGFSNDGKQLALILGNEGQGVSPEINNLADKSIYIPIQQIESLNVAVAGAILMYEFSK